ncbi:hypothetical protein GALL_232440 [mine drainage metagenome]|uniref:Protein containing DUF1178 n=1 Tax=mine drainage metagenome TaxID=410659 RepID=A0A1J5RRT0_9ZZZZ
MIKFRLICAQDHDFEGWFRDGATYDAQSAAAEICCPVCGDTAVRKAPMAPNVIGSRRAEEPPPAGESGAAGGAAAAMPSDLHEALLRLRRHIEDNADNVGERFPEEARRIHSGEAEDRPIYGQASTEEADSLRDEGIDVVTVPWLRQH